MFKNLASNLQRWVEGATQERRRTARTREPSLIVYYWDGSAPEGRKLRDISAGGAFIVTPERWFVGTIVRLILQEFKAVNPEHDGLYPTKSTTLLSRVVRQAADGVGVEFMFSSEGERKAVQEFLEALPKIREEPRGSAHGQALIEFALTLPLLFLLFVNAVNFGGFLFAWITVANAARAGVQYLVERGATFGEPSPPTVAQVQALVANDVWSLPNRASVKVLVCSNKNGVINCSGGGTGVPALDPEPENFALGSVDVAYTYRPFIPLFEFSKLGIHATLPRSMVHRQASMRMLQ